MHKNKLTFRNSLQIKKNFSNKFYWFLKLHEIFNFENASVL